LPGHALAALLLIGPLLAAALLLLASLVLGALLLLASLVLGALLLLASLALAALLLLTSLALAALLLLARARIRLLAGVLVRVVRHNGFLQEGHNTPPPINAMRSEEFANSAFNYLRSTTKLRHELFKFMPTKAALKSMRLPAFHASRPGQFVPILQIRLYARS
jgi:hypothetical protein